MAFKLTKEAIISKQNPEAMAYALKQVIQGTLIADCGSRQLFDITTQELKKEIKQLMLVTGRIQRLMIRNCPGSEDILKRHFNGGEVPLVAHLSVLAFGLSDDTIENINNELQLLIDKQHSLSETKLGEELEGEPIKYTAGGYDKSNKEEAGN